MCHSSNSSSNDKRKHKHHSHKKRCKCSPIGTWVGSAGDPPGIQYIQFQVLPDGHIVFNSSIDVGQPFPGFPYGATLTIGQGYWKKLRHKKYATRQTQLLLNKDLDPANNHMGVPLFRLVVDSTFVISDDCKKLDGEFTVQLYPYDDIYLQHPIGSPIPARTYVMNRLPPL